MSAPPQTAALWHLPPQQPSPSPPLPPWQPQLPQATVTLQKLQMHSLLLPLLHAALALLPKVARTRAKGALRKLPHCEKPQQLLRGRKTGALKQAPRPVRCRNHHRCGFRWRPRWAVLVWVHLWALPLELVVQVQLQCCRNRRRCPRWVVQVYMHVQHPPPLLDVPDHWAPARRLLLLPALQLPLELSQRHWPVLLRLRL
mmetsp:Transcript_44922/g.106641  ORF Transcript_44922/g.106641 Transcript_44922/m.106641 type:complete len:200 (-) Transcript_44922:923-1522(-)